MLLAYEADYEHKGVKRCVMMLYVACFQFAFYAAMHIASVRRYTAEMKERTLFPHLSRLTPAFLWLLDRMKFMERFPDAVVKVHHKIVVLGGSKDAWPITKVYFAKLGTAAYLCILGFTVLGAAAGGGLEYLGFGLAGAGLTPLLLVKELDRQIRKRQQAIILELPEVLNKLILLVNAGETVQRGLIKCAETKAETERKHPFYKELCQAVNELQMNVSLPKVLEDLNKRCAVQEVSRFTSTVLLNYKRGGDEFVLSLRALSGELWERRKAVSRTLGEEASSKLVFPMVIIFLVVMAIIAAPAMIAMSQS
jgi:tight adherence protein C